jgi:hypothetical protein
MFTGFKLAPVSAIVNFFLVQILLQITMVDSRQKKADKCPFYFSGYGGALRPDECNSASSSLHIFTWPWSESFWAAACKCFIASSGLWR